MICVYPADCTDFSTNGNGALSPTSATVTETLNGEYELQLEHPIDENGKWQRLIEGCILRAPVPAAMTPAVNYHASGSSSAGKEIWRIDTDIPTASVRGGTLRLRSGPGDKYKVLANYKNGSIVQVLNKTNSSWYECTAPDGKHGYFFTKYLALERTESSYEAAVNSVVESRQLRDQPFRIYRVVPSLDKITVYARHIFYDLLDNMIASVKPSSSQVGASVVQQISAECMTAHDFTFYSDLDATAEEVEYVNTNPVDALLGEDGVVDKYAGELTRDWFDVYLVKRVGRDTNVQIRQGKNLLGISYDIDITDVVTRIMPTGENISGDVFYLPEVFVDSPYINNYPHPKWMHLPVSEAKESTDEDNPKTLDQCRAEMRAAAQKQFEAGCDQPTVTLNVDYINTADTEEYKDYAFLQNIYLGDAVRMIVPRIGIWVSMRMTQYTYDCLTKRYTKITLGTVADTVEGNVISSRQLPSGIITGTKLAINSVGAGALQNGSVSSAHIQMAAIDTAHIQDAAITRAKIGDAAVGSAQIQDASIIRAKIAEGAIGSAEIDDASITRAKIADAAIGTAQIEDGSINSAHIGSGEIQEAHIHDGAITHAKISDGEIHRAHIEDGAIDSAKIADAAITNAKIDGAAIGTANIQDGAIVRAKILDGEIVTAKIADLAVTSGKIADLAVSTAKIANAAITNAQIANAAVDTAQIALGAITAALIQNGAVGTAQIADASITEGKIVSLNADVIQSGTLATKRLIIRGEDGLIYQINALASGLSMQELSEEQYREQLDGSVLVKRSVTAEQIAAATITANEILSGTITGDKIAAATIEGANLKAGIITTSHLSSEFGKTLDLSSNTGINQRVEKVYTDMGQIEDKADAAQSTADSANTAAENAQASADAASATASDAQATADYLFMHSGRNLVWGTTAPSVEPASRASLNGVHFASNGHGNVNYSGGTLTAVEHGYRVTSAGGARPRIQIGSSTFSTQMTLADPLMGLQPGKTYTLSGDGKFRGFSNADASDTTTYYWRVYAYWARTGATTYPAATVLKTIETFTATNGNRGQEIEARIIVPFTVPENAIAVYFACNGNSSASSLYSEGDFVEIANLKIEEGDRATPWLPAPEDVASSISEARSYAESIVGTVQSQLDGKIDTWFYNAEPTTLNAPAVDWTTEEKAAHTDDLYYDTSSGYCYRWTGSAWERIKDSDITSAMAAASDAQDTADKKRRVFTAQPVPPYDIGDLWAEGAGGDMKVCKTAKAEGKAYAAADWVLASKYTDDSTANAASTAAQAAASAASAAQSTADSAVTAAGQAQTTADAASGKADAAQSTADAASTAAGQAQSTADSAIAAAANAQSTADSALTTAEKALHSTEVIVGTQTATTAAWTGVASFATLEDKQKIVYWLPTTSAANVTLNLTLSTGSTTGAKNVYINGATRCGTHVAAGNLVQMVYRENVTIGTTKYTGWWISRSQDTTTNYYDRINYKPSVTAAEAIAAGRIGVFNSAGKLILLSTTPFDVTMPILYIGTAYTDEKPTQTNNYICFGSTFALNNTVAGFTGVAGDPVYIKGTLNGKLFTPAAGVLTCSVPVSDDSYTYILLGLMSTATAGVLAPEHPMFRFYNGGFKSITEITYEAYVAAEDAASAADTAQSTADSAVTAAGNAQSAASAASSAASAAQSTADSAVTAAGNAQSKADSAYTAAGNAQSKADSAYTAAGNAQSTADTAASAAAAAQSSIDNLEIGGRNLIHGLLDPDVQTRPMINGVPLASGTGSVTYYNPSNTELTVAEHGLRVTTTVKSRPCLCFGHPTLSYCLTCPDPMYGLVASQPYTLSGDLTFLIYSDNLSLESYFRVGLYYALAGDTAWRDYGRIASPKVINGEVCSSHLEATFTLPEGTVAWYLLCAPNNSTAANSGIGDYVELANMKLEKGNRSTDWSPAPEDLEASISEARSYTETVVADVQSQLDGKIDTWFYAAAPTTSNAPAKDWTAEQKASHTDDLYYDTSTGYCYRWTGSSWSRIKDSDIASAMSAASAAQDTADNKRRVFTAQPIPPYDKGDLWAGGSSADLKVCTTARASGAFTETDWSLASASANDIEIGGRNLVLGTANELICPAVTSQSAYTAYMFLSDFGQTELYGDTSNDITVSFNYELTGAEPYGTTAVRVYAQLNGAAGKAKMLYPTAPDEVGRYVSTYSMTSAQATSTSSFRIRVRLQYTVDGATIRIWNLKLEKGNKATDWTPAPEDISSSIDAVGTIATAAQTAAGQAQSKADTAITAAGSAQSTADTALANANRALSNTEIVVGTQTEATEEWTGNASFSALEDGQQIVYWLPYASASNVTLQLTLGNGSTTAAIPCYYSGTTRLGTHYAAGNAVHLTYRENANVNGTAVTGWWADANYNTNTNYYDRINYKASVTATGAIAAGRIGVFNSSGKLILLSTTAFDVTRPILYVGTAYTASALTQTNNYISWGTAFSLANTVSGFKGTAGASVYIKGTLSGHMFTPAAGVLTCTVPSSDDGYTYMLLGLMSTTTNAVLAPEHPVFRYYNGGFKTISQIACEAFATADSAKTTAELTQEELDHLSFGGRNMLRNSATLPEGAWVPNAGTWRISSSGNGTGETTEVDDSRVPVSVGMKITGNTSGNKDLQTLLTTIEPDTEYTFSAWIRILTTGTARVLSRFYGTSSISSTTQEYSSKEYPDWFHWSTTKRTTSSISVGQEITWSIGVAGNSADIEIAAPKLERGNRVTDWSPAPEDADESLQLKLANVYAQITNEGDSIRSEVQANYARASDMTQVQTQLSTLSEQTENNYTWAVTRINQMQEDLNTTREATEDEMAILRTYMTFGEDGLSIGKTGNPFTFRVVNDRLAFYMNDTEVAYLSNNKLYVTQAEILTKLIIGKFAFEPQSNGNLSLIFNG